MRGSFLIAAALGSLCILAFSTAGLYTLVNHIDPVPSVTIAVDVGMMLLFNAVMRTSVGPTLASTAKFGARDRRITDGPPALAPQSNERRAM